ncbi:MAG: pyridoxal phosphate-dependent aminotransferase [Clostridiales bacterium]|nr:pyridoxal phosphate-dependent aminotransferase [Clostridiales bacterium]
MELSRKHLDITASLTLEIDAKAKKMRAHGIDVIGFGAGEPDFDTPSFIIEAAKEALDKGYTKYTPSSGIMELKEAICEKLKRDNNLDYEPNEILISNGAKHSLYNIFQAILNPGDEVIIPSPYWVSYPEMVKMADGVPVYVNTLDDHGFCIDLEHLKNIITKKTKAIVINSPNNPCGSVYDKKQLETIAQLAVEHDFFVVSDEIYEELLYDGAEHISIASLNPEIKERTLLVNGMSKAYAMTGWRIGYTAGKREIISVMSNIQSHSTSNPNSIAQYASLAALKGSKDIIKSMVCKFDERRKFMVDKINSIDMISCTRPQGAFYVMLNIKNVIGKTYNDRIIKGSLDFADVLLEAQNVAVVPGIAFGADEYVRLSYATSKENIEKGLNRIEKFIKELN